MIALMKIFDVLPGWVYALIIAALVAMGGVELVHVAALQAEVSTSKAEIDRIVAEASTKALEAERIARSKEQQLRGFTDQLREQTDAQITSLRADVVGLRKRLSYLPARPAGDPAAASAGFGQAAKGCAGPILYRDTAEALADEAARADVMRINLGACYDAWDRAKEIMESDK